MNSAVSSEPEEGFVEKQLLVRGLRQYLPIQVGAVDCGNKIVPALSVLFVKL